MRATSLTAAAVGAGTAAVLLQRRLSKHTDTREDHWLAVTVNLPMDEVSELAELPGTLEGMREHVETRFRAAAGDKGTEVLARPLDDVVSREDLRIALRQAKSLLETGIVLQADTPSSTHPGPAGRILQAVVAKSKGEGRL
jgi:hypothetical protein